MKTLSKVELESLSNCLGNLEAETLRNTGLHSISGAFATTSIIDYDDDIVDIELQFGVQSDTNNYVESEQYKVDRKSFTIIN